MLATNPQNISGCFTGPRMHIVDDLLIGLKEGEFSANLCRHVGHGDPAGRSRFADRGPGEFHILVDGELRAIGACNMGSQIPGPDFLYFSISSLEDISPRMPCIPEDPISQTFL